MKKTIVRAALMAATMGTLLVLLLYGPPHSRAQQPPPGRPFHCVVGVSTATNLTAVGGDCVALSGQSHYVTSINFSTNAAGIAADSFNTLKYGTGGTCGTGTAIFWTAMTPAATQAQSGQIFPTAIVIPPSNEICWINSSAGSKTLTITGYIQ